MITKTINIEFSREVSKEVVIVPDERAGFTAYFKDREDIIVEAETEEELSEKLAETYKVVRSREFAVKMKELVQGYLGMLPQDKQCKNWPEMTDKMLYEIAELLENTFELKEDEILLK